MASLPHSISDRDRLAMDETRLVAPKTLEETGLSASLMTSLVLKTLYSAGDLTGTELTHRLGVSFGVLEPVLEILKAQRHFTVGGGTMVGGPYYRYGITPEGCAAAAQHLLHDPYVGAAPVPLRQYRDHWIDFESPRIEALNRTMTRDDVREAFSHLVLSDRILDEIGPAFRGRSIFLFGAPGNGKTAIARGLHALLPGEVAIPHAIEVGGSIIRVFDPVVHEREQPDDRSDEALVRVGGFDQRWVTCRRPMIVAGSELTLDALDVTYVAGLGYRAPLQLLANGGLLLIDDFGRQRCAPHDLLNRWMVPLETGTDFMTLRSALRFEVPFLALVIFATNLDPLKLVDEAFLRRVQSKVAVEDPTEEDFVRIFEGECRRLSLPFEREVIEQLLDHSYRPLGLPLRACQPRDLTAQALLLAEYRGVPRRLTSELLHAASASHFAVAPAVGGLRA
jgi:hypothetical protein